MMYHLDISDKKDEPVHVKSQRLSFWEGVSPTPTPHS